MAKKAKKYDDDDESEQRKGGFLRFVRGAITGLLFSAVAVWALSVYVLPPPVIPEPEPEPTGPKIVDGIEVSNEPAYSGTPDQSEQQQARPEPTGTLSLDGPAMVVNSANFSGDLQDPLVAVVLDSTNTQPLLHELIFGLDVPLTVGVIAGDGGDAETAKVARDAGFEVVAQFTIAPTGQSGGSDLEYGLDAADAALRTLTLIQRMPMAVAVSRTLASPTPPDAEVLRGMASVVGPLGFAYLDIDVPLVGESPAIAAGTAESEGALIEVSRHTVPAGASAAAAHAVLDAASADAAERGWAVVTAAPSEGLVQALLLWGGEGEGSLAKMAPLTAVIRKKIGG